MKKEKGNENIQKKIPALTVGSDLCTVKCMHGQRRSRKWGVQDGLRAVLTTDKDTYKANEKISVGISLKNESDQSIENIDIVVKAPEGLNVESGSLKWEGITLGAGKSETSDPIVLGTKKDEGTTQTPSGSGTNNNTNGNAGGSTNNSTHQGSNGSAGSGTDQPSAVYPAPSGKGNQSTQSTSTGDSSQILLWGTLAVLSGAGLVLWFRKKSGKHLLTLLLILAVGGGMIPAMPSEAATERKSFSVTKDITVDGKSYTLEAVISYNIEKEEPVAQKNEIYVATNGDDTAAGTKDAPVQTLEKARALAREAKKNGLATVVYLRSGDYVLNETFTLGAEDSGTKDAPVTYRAYPGEEVIITGSKGYDFSKFQKVDGDMKELLPTADAKEKVVVADVSELGMTLTEVGVTSDSYAITTDLMMLDQHNMKLSRYPNSMSNADWIEASVLSPDKTYGTKPTFKINDDRVWSWSHGTDNFVYLGYFDNGWGATFVKGTMDAENKEVSATTQASWGSSFGKKPVQIYNVYEAMDEPGEWFYDKTTGKLYLYPYEDTTANSKLYVAESDFDLVSVKNAAYINIEGITVKSSAKSGIVMDQVESCVVNNCKLLNFQGRAVDIDHAENSGVMNSDVAYVRGDVIFINGGDYKTFSGGKNFLSNNRIHDTNQLRWFQTAVTIRGVETKVDHNEFFNITEIAVGFGGHSYPDYASVNTMIEYNVFHDCCVNGKDYGVVYAIGDARCQGTVIQYNYFYNIGNESTAYKTDTSAIYADGGLTGLTIKNNIMGPGCSWQTEFARLNGGINHVVENNLIIDTPSLFVNFMYDNFEVQYKTGDAGCGIKETADEVFASDIYKEKYEWIKKAANGESFYVNNKILNNVAVYIDAEPHTEQNGKDNSDPYHAVVPEKVDGIGKNNDENTNLYICKEDKLSFETAAPLKDYGKTDNRELFVDYENGDYRLIDEVLKDTAFKNIDQSGMGLQFFTYDGKSCLPGGYAPEISNVRLSQEPKAGEEIAAVYDFTDQDGDGDLATYANFYISETAEEDFYLNIWECTRKLPTDACNFIFNEKEEFGSLVWNENELGRNGDWWDSGFADDGTMTSQDHRTLLYCEKNPADYYEHIECVLHKYRSLGETGENMVIEDLIFCNNGIHGIAGENPARNIMIRNCEFYHIGGCVWSLSQKIRFGNGVECWNVAENVTVENCKFDDIYDSAVTHQGGPECETAKGFYIRNNEFSRCGMAAYEQRDRLPKEGEFSGNICLDAGRGFSHFRTEIPRNSEIWPQPMGHHIFLWRIEQGETLCDFKIENNTFKDAPYGAAIYSIIHPEAEKQLTFANNHYEMKQFEMIAHLSGKMIMDPEKCIALTENPQSE